MPFIGNQPALSYTSFAKQDFTTSATTSYTLDNPVTNENEIALFINFVRQEPTTAYTASGTTLTLTSATSASDDMYCVFLGKAVQTVNPPSGSVGTSQLANNAVTTAKITDANITSAKLASGVLPTNTPYFYAYSSNGQTPADGVWTVVELDAEHVDSNGAFDTSTYKFTVPSGQAGKYCIGGRVLIDAQADSNIHEAGVMIGVNGTKYDQSYANYAANYPRDVTHNTSAIINLSVGDYVQLYGYINDIAGSGMDFKGNANRQTAMWGFKIIE